MKTISWRTPLLLAALALLALGLAACGGQTVAAQELAETPAPAPEQEASPAVQEEKEPVSTLDYETYVAILPAASGGMRVMALRLFEDGTLEWETDFHNGEPPIQEVGVWQINGDGAVAVTVTGQVDRAYDEPNQIVFQRDDDQLVAVAYDVNMYGSQGLQLMRAADLASRAEKALFTLDLAAGFPLDPTFMSVNAGGEVDASLLGPKCRGFVSAAPVVSVNWTGAAEFVEVFFVSDDDPTLVVLTPDGQVLCNDDANDHLLDPVIEINNPAEGQYRIWVGSFNEGHLLPGILVLTTKPEVNLGTFNLGSFIQRTQIPEVVPQPESIADRQALIETLEMALAESPEVTAENLPIQVDVIADGIVPLFQLPLAARGCSGLVTGSPTYTFSWAGEIGTLRAMFEGDEDSSLLVIGPDRTVVCNDDSADGSNLNPVIDITNPAPGLYAVYVGRLSPENPVTGVLSITDDTDAPDILAPTSD
jgi:hypothetical protein